LVGEFVGALGASVYSMEACRAALRHERVGVVQIPANPLKRDVLEAVTACDRADAHVFARSLLGQGVLTADVATLPAKVAHLATAIEKFQKACFAMGRSPLEVCLLWARDTPVLDGLIIGAASRGQLEEIATMLSRPALSYEELEMIDALERPDPDMFDPRTW
jgi:aryl-alcohol dehydrogenase-like predicted oxidoreductase